MLDAFLAGIRSLGSCHAVRNVANESDMFAAANVCDREVGVATKIGLHFDEISTAGNQRMDIFAGFRRVGDNQRGLKKWRVPIEIRPRKENSRSLELPVSQFRAASDKGIEIAAHVADRGDPIRK